MEVHTRYAHGLSGLVGPPGARKDVYTCPAEGDLPVCTLRSQSSTPGPHEERNKDTDTDLLITEVSPTDHL